MKRSEINDIMARGDAFIRSFGFALPPFAYWTPAEFAARGAAAGPLRDAGLGWDITDYGQGDFERLGLLLFTLRNGSRADLERGGGMCYAEKIMISRRDQVSPMHRHWRKAEDIVNRGGARLAIELFGAGPDGGFDAAAGGTVFCDGMAHEFAAGDVLLLESGESVTLMPGDWHAFWGEGGDVLVGEVSTVNDDATDNWFRDPVGRFAEVEEDAPPLHLLARDYARFPWPDLARRIWAPPRFASEPYVPGPVETVEPHDVTGRAPS